MSCHELIVATSVIFSTPFESTNLESWNSFDQSLMLPMIVLGCLTCVNIILTFNNLVHLQVNHFRPGACSPHLVFVSDGFINQVQTVILFVALYILVLGWIDKTLGGLVSFFHQSKLEGHFLF